MSADLARHWAYLQEEWRGAQAAPLSLRKAMVVVGLIDAYADRLFAVDDEGDVLAFRAELAAQCPALASVFAVAAHRVPGPRIEVQAMPVPVAEMSQLSVEDFMVSLYNDHSVQRLMIVADGESPALAHPVLAAAMKSVWRLASAELSNLWDIE